MRGFLGYKERRHSDRSHQERQHDAANEALPDSLLYVPTLPPTMDRRPAPGSAYDVSRMAQLTPFVCSEPAPRATNPVEAHNPTERLKHQNTFDKEELILKRR